MTSPLLEVRDLAVRFRSEDGDVAAVSGVSAVAWRCAAAASASANGTSPRRSSDPPLPFDLA